MAPRTTSTAPASTASASTTPASTAPASPSARPSGVSRAELIADTALTLLTERGMRGLTHRAVDERAGLPQGSTSNHARTRQALLEAAVRRQAEREARVLTPVGTALTGDGRTAPADALALALHRYLTAHPELLVARYELALEATRRPELRAFYDATGRQFRDPLVAMMRAAGSTEPERHAHSLVAWCDGLLFSCAAGSYHSAVPSLDDLRRGFTELLRGMLGDGAAERGAEERGAGG
ncbi:TetR/AcrR family transcriptional regulator [Streptomyces paludis]|uniref:TetR family transcriptional regulator n=1 Tax=Streptomyces paludis TaxID=2282738 RepID=A0A345HJ61_9ACTN|nr:TetR/AcrR family transcriptional regulator [Streptomyces paludis]AXG76735.1 TetR family transcriptional regulator [Streptomyces paludis]